MSSSFPFQGNVVDHEKGLIHAGVRPFNSLKVTFQSRELSNGEITLHEGKW